MNFAEIGWVNDIRWTLGPTCQVGDRCKPPENRMVAAMPTPSG